MNRTKIEYLTYTWNPIAMRCTPVSEGCENCWHLRMCNRMKENPTFRRELQDAYAGGQPVLLKDRLEEPLRRKKPSIIGVQFMGDLFHEDIPDRWINHVFNTITETPAHTYIVLTKRPERMFEWQCRNGYLPRPNVVGLVTAETQERADEHIPWLLRTPLAVRGVSVEPMLENMTLREYLYPISQHWVTVGTGPNVVGAEIEPGRHGLNWCIAGGESGPGARPMHLEWARSLRDQCQAANVPFFFKQWGEYAPVWNSKTNETGYTMMRVGRREAGHLLDGKEWHQWPTP